MRSVGVASPQSRRGSSEGVWGVRDIPGAMRSLYLGRVRGAGDLPKEQARAFAVGFDRFLGGLDLIGP